MGTDLFFYLFLAICQKKAAIKQEILIKNIFRNSQENWKRSILKYLAFLMSLKTVRFMFRTLFITLKSPATCQDCQVAFQLWACLHWNPEFLYLFINK